MIRGEHGIQRMPCSTRIISEMLPEVQTMENFDFLKSIITGGERTGHMLCIVDTSLSVDLEDVCT